ncbi:MAG: hypothetical protein ACFFD4_14325 [Candidatus Odinarchaeota archaeon]
MSCRVGVVDLDQDQAVTTTGINTDLFHVEILLLLLSVKLIEFSFESSCPVIAGKRVTIDKFNPGDL